MCSQILVMRTPETLTGPVQGYKPVKYKTLAIETELKESGSENPQPGIF